MKDRVSAKIQRLRLHGIFLSLGGVGFFVGFHQVQKYPDLILVVLAIGLASCGGFLLSKLFREMRPWVAYAFLTLTGGFVFEAAGFFIAMPTMVITIGVALLITTQSLLNAKDVR